MMSHEEMYELLKEERLLFSGFIPKEGKDFYVNEDKSLFFINKIDAEIPEEINENTTIYVGFLDRALTQEFTEYIRAVHGQTIEVNHLFYT